MFQARPIDSPNLALVTASEVTEQRLCFVGPLYPVSQICQNSGMQLQHRISSEWGPERTSCLSHTSPFAAVLSMHLSFLITRTSAQALLSLRNSSLLPSKRVKILVPATKVSTSVRDHWTVLFSCQGEEMRFLLHWIDSIHPGSINLALHRIRQSRCLAKLENKGEIFSSPISRMEMNITLFHCHMSQIIKLLWAASCTEEFKLWSKMGLRDG